MKYLFALLLMVATFAAPALAQTGVLAPSIYPVFTAANGITPAALGFVCTTTTATSNSLATYQDALLTTANQNPIRLSAQGRAVNGSTLVGIYLQGLRYRFTLYAAGTGNTCNGTTVGTQLWQRDEVSDLAALMLGGFGTFTSVNNREFCATGATMGAKFTAAAALLPSTGGIVDCSGLQGAQSISSDVFTGVTKPITVIWPSGTTSSAVSLAQPATQTWQFNQGAILSMATSTVATISGGIDASLSQHFAGAGTINLVSVKAPCVPPEWFGAIADGVTDSTAATQAAITAAGASSAVCLGHGTYKWTSQVRISADKVTFCGAGQDATQILFAPTANATALKIQSTGTLISSGKVCDLTFYSNDSTWVKVAIDSVDVSDYLYDNIKVSGSVVHGGATFWSDSTNGSIALRTNGRDQTTYCHLIFAGDKPIVMALNPNSSGVIDADHFHFCDLKLFAHQNPLITINTGVAIFDVVFDGHQAWTFGTHGLKWVDTTAVGQSMNLVLRNVRWEQNESAGWLVDVEQNVLLRGLEITNAIWGSPSGTSADGIKLRNVSQVQINGMDFGAPGVAFDFNSTVINIALHANDLTATGVTESFGGALGIDGCYFKTFGGRMTCYSPNTPNVAGGVTQYLDPSTTLAFNQFEPAPITVGANTVVKLASNELKGILIISTGSTTVGAIFIINGTANTTAIMAVSAALWWGAAAGAEDFNIYSSGGEYKLQNNTGTSETFTINFMGVGEH